MTHWVSTSGCNIPENAIRAGYEKDGRPLYIARAKMECTETAGKCAPHLGGAHIPYDGEEKIVHNYEVLVYSIKDQGFVDWQKASNGNVPCNAVKTDNDKFVGRVFAFGSLIPCKIDTAHNHMCAYMGYDGKEHNTKDYEVLCNIK